MEYQEAADSTLDVGGIGPQDDWISTGSGFHYIDESHVLTNYHVVEPLQRDGATIWVRTEDNDRSSATLVDYSPVEREGGADWALLEMADDLGDTRNILSAGNHELSRGDEVVFAGFPHGVGYGEVPDLLVQSARIAGSYGGKGYYLDGSVNKGNSGGPVIHLDSESVIGYTTFKRYVEHQLIDEVMNAWGHLHEQVSDADEVFRTGGLGYYDVLTEMTRSFLLLRETIETNANTGIGVAFDIDLAPETT